MRNVLILLLAISLSMPSSALARRRGKKTRIKPMRLCLNQATGKILAKARCKGSETQLSQGNLGVIAGLAGPMGPQGPAGPAGTVDPNKCVTRSGTNTGTVLVIARAQCASGEFLLTHGMESSSVATDVIEIALLYGPGQPYPSGVEYETGINGPPTAYQIYVDAVCCTP